MLEGLTFGWRTAVLSVAAVQLVLLSIALCRTMANPAANRTLAALLAVMTGMIMPWLIGFAGFYDRWQALTFAPLQISLTVAPLAWLYLRSLTEGVPPQGWQRHLIPAAVQFVYLSACFCLPLTAKIWWSETSTPIYKGFSGLVLLGQVSWYGLDSARRLRRYRARLGDHVADTNRFAVRWLSAAFAALGAMFATWAIYLIWDLLNPLGYRELMGLYIAIAAVSLYLGIEGWRHGALPFPRLGDLEFTAAPEQRDWSTLGREWSDRVRAEGWARDSDLTLARLARRLGTNTGYLSRAINKGLGTNFAGFIAALRAEAVAVRLRRGDRADLLTIAFEEGFGSKASFNRAFIAATGEAPSAFRRRVSKPE
jgi:AraC-like DNA-binding protein